MKLNSVVVPTVALTLSMLFLTETLLPIIADRKRLKTRHWIALACIALFAICAGVTLSSPETTVGQYDDTKRYQLIRIADWYDKVDGLTNELILENDGMYYFNTTGRVTLKHYRVPKDLVSVNIKDGFDVVAITQSYETRRRQFLFFYIEDDYEIGQPTYSFTVSENAITDTYPYYDD